jgi:type VI secretion system secreted protein VgrG
LIAADPFRQLSNDPTMAKPTQANRLVSIKTPLGNDVLLVRRCSIREHLNRLFEIELELQSTEHSIEFDDIVAQKVTLDIELPDGSHRFFNGHVSRFVQLTTERELSRYRASVVPWLWFLTRTSDCKIFQQCMQEPPEDMSVPGIAKKIFKDLGFEDFRLDGLSETYRKWDFCVQYRETAFNFITRLLEQEGITYFFEHEDGKHTLVLADSINAHHPLPGYDKVPYHTVSQGPLNREAITDWVIEREVQPGTYALNDYNFEKPKQALQKALVVKSTVSRTHEKSDYEIYDYPGEFLEHNEGEVLARLRIQELQVRHETLHGQATALGFGAGHTFEMTEHPREDQNRQYLITSVSYDIDNGDFGSNSESTSQSSFSCSLKAIDAAIPFRPPRITPKPQVQGVQTAIVVGPSGEEIHTDAHARVKVQFHWDRYGAGDENSSCWIRVSHANAGKGWGSMITPRIGQEVIVEFLEADPDRPIITGRVYNGEQTAPYAGGNGVVSGMKSKTHKGGGFNEMSMDDTPGSEKITVHGQFDMNTTVENNQTDVVHNNREATVDVNDKESIGVDQAISIGSNQKTTVGSNQELSVGSNQTISIGANQTAAIGANQETSVGANQLTAVGADQSNTVGANQVDDVGGNRNSSIGGNEEVAAGGNIAFDAGGNVTINASGKITLSAGGSSIEIAAAGVTIQTGAKVTVQGSVINLN